MPLTLALHNRISQGGIDRSSDSEANTVYRPDTAILLEATVVSGVLIHRDDDRIVLGIVLLQIGGKVIHRAHSSWDSKRSCDEVVLWVDDQ